MAPASTSSTTIPASLDIHAEVRYRLEIDGREKIIPNSSTTERSFLRARLSVNAALPKDVSVFLEAQDARVYGEEPSPESGTGSKKDLHQGYILAENFITPGLWLRLGRMELIYGNERLVGADDFTNTGRAFDGAVVGYRGEQFDVEVFETKIGESVGSTFRGRDYDFFGTFASIRSLAQHTIDLYAFYDRDADTLATGEDVLKRLTIGGRLAGARTALSYEVEGGAQTGDQGRSSISAAYFGGRLSYKFSGQYEPQITAGADWLSGDGDSTDTDFKAFNTLYASNHKFYGNMDLFIDLPEDTQNLGLLDLLIGVSGKPVKWLDARAFYHNFQSAEDFVLTAPGGVKSGLSFFGHELDLIGEIPCTENVTVETAFSYFSPGEIIEPFVLQRTGVSGGPDDAYLFYLQAKVGF